MNAGMRRSDEWYREYRRGQQFTPANEIHPATTRVLPGRSELIPGIAETNPLAGPAPGRARPKLYNPYAPYMAAYCREVGIEIPESEHYFHPTRGWRIDFAWVRDKIGVELDGGIHTGGAHARGAGIENDQEKGNAAVLLGWRIFHFQPDQLADAARAVRLLLLGVVA